MFRDKNLEKIYLELVDQLMIEHSDLPIIDRLNAQLECREIFIEMVDKFTEKLYE